MRRLILTALLAFTVGFAPPAYVVLSQERGPTNDSVIGFMSCASGFPRGWVRTDLPQPLRDAVAAHEHAHVEMAERFENCREYTRWVQNPTNRWVAEAFAYCREAEASVELGMYESLEIAIWDLAPVMVSPSYHWPSPWTAYDAAASIASECGVEL